MVVLKIADNGKFDDGDDERVLVAMVMGRGFWWRWLWAQD